MIQRKHLIFSIINLSVENNCHRKKTSIPETAPSLRRKVHKENVEGQAVPQGL